MGFSFGQLFAILGKKIAILGGKEEV